MVTAALQLQNHFLVAMPSLNDVNFSHAVVYICAHNADGCMGMVINNPLSDIRLGEVLQQMQIVVTKKEVLEQPVYLGGPVQPERGFILHGPSTQWQSTLVSGNDIRVTSSSDILKSIAEGQGPMEAIVVLGYSGWAAGQIEQELADNMWLTVPAAEHAHVIFDTVCEGRWQAAGKCLGFDFSDMSDEIGHA